MNIKDSYISKIWIIVFENDVYSIVVHVSSPFYYHLPSIHRHGHNIIVFCHAPAAHENTTLAP